jgi:cyclohexa-1,5-dienecarbonyl-CoA hydratase
MTLPLSTISLDLQPNIARIALNNPPLNVITPQMMEELTRAFSQIDQHPEVSVVVIRGAGGSFSAGVAVAVHTSEHVQSMLEKFHEAVRAVMASRKVVVAAVRGHCLGGGAELAMVCDLVYTTKSARWAFPEVSLGCLPPVACTALAALIGQKRAAEMILTGRTIKGVEAAAVGLANRAVPDYKLDATVESVVRQLSKLSASSLALAKKAIYAWDSMHFDKGLARSEKIYMEELMKTEDAQEGINAFLQKRKPQWKGR